MMKRSSKDRRGREIRIWELWNQQEQANADWNVIEEQRCIHSQALAIDYPPSPRPSLENFASICLHMAHFHIIFIFHTIQKVMRG